MSKPFTHKKLTEVEDSAAKFGHGDVMEVRFATGDLEAEDAGCSYHRLQPNKRQAFGHRHENAEEIYVVIRGSGRLKLDDEVIEIEALDAVRISPQVTRAFEAGQEGIEVFAFGARHEGDGEIVPGWWSD